MEKQKSTNSKVEKALSEIVYLRNQIEGLQLLLNGKKEVIKQYFEKSGTSNIKTNDVTAFVQTRTKVDYDINKIKQKLEKDLYKLFIKCQYTLRYKEFIKVCRLNNIDAKLFRNAIIKTESVDEAKLEQLYEQNEISIKDLEGCYDAKVSKTVSFRFYDESRKSIPISK